MLLRVFAPQAVRDFGSASILVMFTPIRHAVALEVKEGRFRAEKALEPTVPTERNESSGERSTRACASPCPRRRPSRAEHGGVADARRANALGHDDPRWPDTVGDERDPRTAGAPSP